MPNKNEVTRKPIIWGVSVSRLRLIFQDVIPSYSSFANVRVVDKGFDEALDTIHELMKTSDVDVLVSAGSNGAYIRRHVSIPVVLIKVSGFDVLYALTEARKISKRIGIVTFKTIDEELKRFKTLFNLDIQQHSYQSEDDARECVPE